MNTLAQVVGTRAFSDEEYANQTLKMVQELRAGFIAKLETLPGLRVLPGVANFLLVALEDGHPQAKAIAERLLSRGIVIRIFPEKHPLAGRYVRLAVRPEGEQLRFLEALVNVLKLPSTPLGLRPKHKPAIMFQGSGSNVGKNCDGGCHVPDSGSGRISCGPFQSTEYVSKCLCHPSR